MTDKKLSQVRDELADKYFKAQQFEPARDDCEDGFRKGFSAALETLAKLAPESLPECPNYMAHPQSVWFEEHWKPKFDQLKAQLAKQNNHIKVMQDNIALLSQTEREQSAEIERLKEECKINESHKATYAKLSSCEKEKESWIKTSDAQEASLKTYREDFYKQKTQITEQAERIKELEARCAGK